MNNVLHRASAVQLFGLSLGANRKGVNPVYLLLVLGLLVLASPVAVLGAGPVGSDAVAFGGSADSTRLAAVVRFYTDRYERAAHANSAEYTAMAKVLSEGRFSEKFGDLREPARMAAVTRFYTDPNEGADSAGMAQYGALVQALGGTGGASLESAALAGTTDSARLAAVVRFYTDRHERAANADSSRYKAMAVYLSQAPFPDEFAAPLDPARLAAVARFYTDPYERAFSANSPKYVALAKSLSGAGTTTHTDFSCGKDVFPTLLCSAETSVATP